MEIILDDNTLLMIAVPVALAILGGVAWFIYSYIELKTEVKSIKEDFAPIKGALMTLGLEADAKSRRKKA